MTFNDFLIFSEFFIHTHFACKILNIRIPSANPQICIKSSLDILGEKKSKLSLRPFKITLKLPQ
jgi:hypothetical protein